MPGVWLWMGGRDGVWLWVGAETEWGGDPVIVTLSSSGLMAPQPPQAEPWLLLLKETTEAPGWDRDASLVSGPPEGPVRAQSSRLGFRSQLLTYRYRVNGPSEPQFPPPPCGTEESTV